MIISKTTSLALALIGLYITLLGLLIHLLLEKQRLLRLKGTIGLDGRNAVSFYCPARA